MRELKHVPNELELGLDLELESDDVAAAEAAVAALSAESQGQISCSCCNELLETAEQLHIHQMGQHTLTELSLALLTLRGLDLPITNGSVEENEKFCVESGLNRLLLDTVEKRLHDSDGESTITVDSEARMATLDNLSPLHMAFSSPYYVQTPSPVSSRFNGMTAPMIASSYGWTNMYPHLDCGDSTYMFSSYPSYGYSMIHSKPEINDDPTLWSDVNGNDLSQDQFLEGTVPGQMTKKSEIVDNAERTFQEYNVPICTNTDSQRNQPKSSPGMSLNIVSDQKQGARKKSSLYKHLSSVRKVKRVRFEDSADFSEEGVPTCGASPYKVESKAGDSRSKSDARLFFCDSCGRGYKKKSHLERHLRVHTGVRPYPCTMCDKRFAVRSVLIQHLRVHTGERPYSCSICMQRFPQKSGLMTHMMLHTGKPFKCEFCVKSFVSNHKLVLHRRSTHNHSQENVSAVGPYQCSSCDMRFFTSGALTEHCKIHNKESMRYDGREAPAESSVDSGVYCSQSPEMMYIDCRKDVARYESVTTEEPVTITEEAAIAAVAVVGKLHKRVEPAKRKNKCKEELCADPLRDSEFSVNYYLNSADGDLALSDFMSFHEEDINQIKSEPLVSIMNG